MHRQLISFALSTAVALSAATAFAAAAGGGGAAPPPAPAPGGSSASGSSVLTAPTPQGAPSAQTPQGAPSAPTPQGAFTAPVPSGPTSGSNPAIGNTSTNLNMGNTNTNASMNQQGNRMNNTTNGTAGSTVVLPPGSQFSTNGPVPNIIVPNTTAPGVFFLGDSMFSSSGGVPLNNYSLTPGVAPASPGGTSSGSGVTPPSAVGGGDSGMVTNVPPPGTYTNDGPAPARTMSGPIVLEGQLADLYSASVAASTGRSGATATVAPRVDSAAPLATSVAPSEKMDVQVITADSKKPTPSAMGSTAAVSEIPSGNTFGTYSRPNAASTPGPAPIVSSTPSATTVRSADGKISMTRDNKLDTGEISRELSGGVPAVILANGQAYILVCDSRQLASYAGQRVRVSGRILAGTIIPERLEARGPSGEGREITLSLPGGMDRSRVRAATERE